MSPLSRQLMALTVLPALALTLLLAGGLGLVHERATQRAVQHTGEGLAAFLATATTEALRGGDAALLTALARSALTHPDVAAVVIEDRSGRHIAYGDVARHAEASVVSFQAPVSWRGQSAYGEVSVLMRPASGGGSLAPAAAASGIVLLLAALAAWMSARRLDLSLAEVERLLCAYAGGSLAARAGRRAPAALAPLVDRAHAMADALQQSREELERQVEQTTGELRETIEEVEIKNVELDLARKRALQGSRAKSELLANMSHEIRTPLNAVVGYTRLLADTRLDSEQRGYLDTIAHSADGLLDIIDDVLNLSRLESGKLALQRQPFDVRELLARLVEMLAPAAYAKGLDFVRHVDPRVPQRLRGDAARIRQILTNLITNAIKYTERGSVSLELTAAGRARERRVEVHFTVRDTGVGISREHRERLFRAFSRARIEDDLQTGFGLGLMITRRLCEAMSGRITVDTLPDQGSRFVVSLPLDRCEDPADAHRRPALAGRSVLVRARDAAQRRWARQWLLDAGVDEVHTGAVETATTDEGVAACDAAVLYLDAADCGRLEEGPAKREAAAPPLPTLALVASADAAVLRRVVAATGATVLPAFVAEATAAARLAALVEGSIIDAESPAPSAPARMAASGRPGAVAGVASPVTLGVEDDVEADGAGLARAGGAAPAGVGGPAAGGDDAVPTGAGVRVLVVDDDRLNREYLSQLLSRRGAVVESCGDGLAAQQLARERDYDLLLMDMRMPRCGGVEATRAIRAAGRGPAVIGMTASVVPGEREAMIAAGMDECLSKPLRPDALLALIARYRRPTGGRRGAPAGAGDGAGTDAADGASAIPRASGAAAGGAAAIPRGTGDAAGGATAIPRGTGDAAGGAAAISRGSGAAAGGAAAIPRGTGDTAGGATETPRAAGDAAEPAMATGADATLEELLRAELPQRLRRLRAAADCGDHESTLAEAHKLNGAAAVFRLTALRDAAADLEGALRRGEHDGLEPRVDRVESALQAALQTA